MVLSRHHSHHALRDQALQLWGHGSRCAGLLLQLLALLVLLLLGQVELLLLPGQLVLLMLQLLVQVVLLLLLLGHVLPT